MDDNTELFDDMNTEKCLVKRKGSKTDGIIMGMRMVRMGRVPFFPWTVYLTIPTMGFRCREALFFGDKSLPKCRIKMIF